jgi:hypothetical protein
VYTGLDADREETVREGEAQKEKPGFQAGGGEADLLVVQP